MADFTGRSVLPRAAVWLLAVGVLIGACAALWLVGEIHYRNCLTHAQMKAESYGAFSTGLPGAKCSRLPF